MLDFYKGVDISFLPEQEDSGIPVRDMDGTVTDPFALLKKYGVNAVRLRLWHTPENVPQTGGYCSLPHTIAMAKRARAKGMSLMLDFHYSDFWADPAKQNKPLAWKGLSGSALEEAVYRYTRDTLLAMEREGVLPDIVQIGNEIRSGLLFPDGELPDWGRMVCLVNAGMKGAREAAGASGMQVMIHLDQGGRYFFLRDWFEKAKEHGLWDFDLIGLSYYPFWHGTFADLKETLVKLTRDYRKPVMVVETAHAWRRGKDGFIDAQQERIAGIEASPSGQRRVLELVENIVASVPNQMGKGFYYWEPLCVPRKGEGGWANNMGILDEDGRVMEAIHAFSFERQDRKGGRIAKIYEPQPMQARPGDSVPLPETVQVLFFDGHVEARSVTWQEPEVASENERSRIVTGIVDGTRETVKLLISEAEESAQKENILQDTNWDAGLVCWKMQKEDCVQVYISPEFSEPFPAPPVNTLCVEGQKNFSFCISQTVLLVGRGSYSLSAEVCGTDTTGVDVRLFAEQDGRVREYVIHPEDQGFTEYRITGLLWEKGSGTVGIRISAPPMRCRIRRFCLRRDENDRSI